MVSRLFKEKIDISTREVNGLIQIKHWEEERDQERG